MHAAAVAEVQPGGYYARGLFADDAVVKVRDDAALVTLMITLMMQH